MDEQITPQMAHMCQVHPSDSVLLMLQVRAN